MGYIHEDQSPVAEGMGVVFVVGGLWFAVGGAPGLGAFAVVLGLVFATYMRVAALFSRAD